MILQSINVPTSNIINRENTPNLGSIKPATIPYKIGPIVAENRPTNPKNPKNSPDCSLGMITAKIKTFRTPEPYKGKGIKELGQYILRKEGKKK